MAEEQKEQPQPNPQQATESVRLLKSALELAKTATHYKAMMEIKSRDTHIFKDDKALTNPVLADYILNAEREFVVSKSEYILSKAKQLLENDIEEIRRLVNG